MHSVKLSVAVLGLLLLLVALVLQPGQAGLHPVRPRRSLATRVTVPPSNSLGTTTTTRPPITPGAQLAKSIDPSSQYVSPEVAYTKWTAWTYPASGAIPSCMYCKKQLKGFLACAAKQTYPDGMPPYTNWTAPRTCLDQYAGMQECQFGEVGYAIMQTIDPKLSVKLIYGTVTGGCKDSVNYYAILSQRPKALTAKACTSLNTKILKCILETNNNMDYFDNTYTGCSVYSTRKQNALALACWTNPSTYQVYYDGYNNTAWLASFATTTGLSQYNVYPLSQAFYKGGQTAAVKHTVVAGSMGSLQPWMGG